MSRRDKKRIENRKIGANVNATILTKLFTHTFINRVLKIIKWRKCFAVIIMKKYFIYIWGLKNVEKSSFHEAF